MYFLACIFQRGLLSVSCPETLGGFWQQTEAFKVDTSSKCHYYTTLKSFKDPNRFELKDMAYCADNGNQGTIDPVRPNEAVNTTGEISQ